MKQLKEMLRLCRAHDSEGEKVFVKKFIAPRGAKTFSDSAGVPLAYAIEVGLGSKTLFCGHVDTMHPADAPLHQTVVYDAGSGMFYKDSQDTLPMPLGADNAAGCWLLLQMISAGVPGTYLFHRGEERGGIGSRGMATHYADFLKQFNYAIAFDRCGTNDVITEMACGRTCSNVFAQALADKLNTHGVQFDYAPDDTGSFTDTANYRRLIPECTNVSVGYDYEHGPHETLDAFHLIALRNAVVAAFQTGGTGDTEALPVVRRVTDVDEPSRGFGWRGAQGYGGGEFPSYKEDYSNAIRWNEDGWSTDFCLTPRDATEVLSMKFKDLVKWADAAHPEDIADLLMLLAEEVEYSKV